MKTRTYRRLKSRFSTARKAWRDIKKSIKGDYRAIKSGPHTSKHWVFRVT